MSCFIIISLQLNVFNKLLEQKKVLMNIDFNINLLKYAKSQNDNNFNQFNFGQIGSKSKIINFKGKPEVKVCGVHDKPSILAAISAAREAKADNLIIGLLLGITHSSKEKVLTEKAPELIKYIKTNSFSMNIPVKVACVTHLKSSYELVNLINKISKDSLEGDNGLKKIAKTASDYYGYSDTSKLTSSIFDIIQIHDDMPIEEIKRVKETFPDIKIIKAMHVPKKGESYKLDELITKAVNLAKNSCIDGLLLDSSNLSQNQIGGTGLTNDWNIAKVIIDEVHNKTGKPVALAGGLSPDNVFEAIKTTHADIIDANSGYRFDRKDNYWRNTSPKESSPKDPFAIFSILNQVKKINTKYNLTKES